MYYRRKIILALLQVFDNELEKIRLQKLLFLFCQQQEKPDYDFVPYKFGCFSYSANADLTAMSRQEQVAESETFFRRTDSTNYLAQLKPNDKTTISLIKTVFGPLSANALMKETYTRYPFYAIHSTVAKNVLSLAEQEIVSQSKPIGKETILFTIGYEGISLEEYLNRLLRNDIKVLVDVRNNPLSMKYGFSKSQLSRFCENLDIQYQHFPEVGIQSDQRQTLHYQSDYDQLFEQYRIQNLTKTQSTQQKIMDLLKTHQRIALTCFEANICQCHRSHLATAISLLPEFHFEVKHI